MDTLEFDICDVILENHFVFDLCREAWKNFLQCNSTSSEAFEDFSDYLHQHFYDLIVVESQPLLYDLMYDLINLINFNYIADYVIDFF